MADIKLANHDSALNCYMQARRVYYDIHMHRSCSILKHHALKSMHQHHVPTHAPTQCTNTMHQHNAPTQFTNTMHQHNAPTQFTNTIHQHNAPTQCTNTMHQHYAPTLCTNTMHQHYVQSPPTHTCASCAYFCSHARKNS